MRPSRAVVRNAKELFIITLACLYDLVSNFALKVMAPLIDLPQWQHRGPIYVDWQVGCGNLWGS